MNALQQESEAGQAGLTSLGSAVTPASPYFPNVPRILLGALGFGAAIGALSGLLFEFVNRRVWSEGDFVKGLDMSMLAVMARASGAGEERVERKRDGGGKRVVDAEDTGGGRVIKQQTYTRQ